MTETEKMLEGQLGFWIHGKDEYDDVLVSGGRIKTCRPAFLYGDGFALIFGWAPPRGISTKWYVDLSGEGAEFLTEQEYEERYGDR